MANYNDKYASFYNSTAWKKARLLKVAQANGLCQRCLDQGKIVKGDQVHHIVPIENDMRLALVDSNLIVLCKECHNAVHDRQSPLQDFIKEWDKV